MKKKYLLLTSITSLLLLVGCEVDNTDSPDAEVEQFSDEVISNNMELALDGFTLTGTIQQIRYDAIDTGETDEWGDEIYEIDTSETLETNTYYTTVKYDNVDQNKFYKYSYRLVSGVEIAAEGPYTYYEDEEGYAYTAEVDYTNTLSTSYNQGSASGGRKYNFAANGFYNFFTIFNDNDFALDEEKSGTALSYYNISTSKANIICNNLLYSLNSGVYTTIDEAYIMCVNGVFTQLYIDLTAIQSVDDDTSEVTYIDNTVTFTFSDLGETTIEEPELYEETTESNALDAILDTYEDNFTIDVSSSYTYAATYDETDFGEAVENKTFYYTGDEIYVKQNSTVNAYDVDTDGYVTTQSSVADFYLAPLNNTSNLLYPYGYDSTSNEWVAYESGYTDENSNVVFASGYSGYYTYDDLLPIISDVSGAVFEYDETDQEYDAIYDMIADMTSDGCFITNVRPLRTTGYSNASTFHISITSGAIVVTAGYNYYDSDYVMYYGNVTITFSNVGTTTLPID